MSAPGQGVVDGMHFVVLEDTGVAVLAVAGLTVSDGGRLLVRDTHPLVVLSAGNAEIQGMIDLSAFVCVGEDIAQRT